MELGRRGVVEIGRRSEVLGQRVLCRLHDSGAKGLAVHRSSRVPGERRTIAGAEEGEAYIRELPAADLRVGGDADDGVVADAARELEERRAIASVDSFEFPGDEDLSRSKVGREI